MHARTVLALGLLVFAVGVSGCGAPPRAATPQAPGGPRQSPAPIATASVEPTTASLPFPFDGSGLPLVPLDAALAEISGHVSLPDARVVGAPRAAMVNHARPKSRNALWLYYDPGVFFEVEPLPELELELDYALRRVAASSHMTHPDGTPCVTLRMIRGRATAVTTPGGLLLDGQVSHVREVAASVAWANDGRMYLVRSLPMGLHGEGAPGSPSLDVLLRFAEATP